MPLLKMEPAVVEERDKVIKKKRKAEVDTIKGNMKISDHFKTPEKEVQLVSKQKSLLHFFAKSPAAVIVNNNANSKAISDKENSLSRKSIVFPKWTSSEETNTQSLRSLNDDEELKKEKSIEILDDSMEINKATGKDNKKSDSVIMLSDTSTDAMDTDMVDGGNSEEKPMSSKKNKKPSKNHVKKCTDKVEQYNGKDKKSRQEELVMIDDQQNDDCEEDANKKEKKVKSVEASGGPSDKKPHDRSESVGKSKVAVSGPKSNATVNDKDSKGQMSKKSTLKGSEMMSLLKEIKNSEKMEKKKKHKHKEKSKAVIEISDPACSANEKGETANSEDSVISYMLNEKKKTSDDVPKKEKKLKRQIADDCTDIKSRTLLKGKSKLKKNKVETETLKLKDSEENAESGDEIKQNNKPPCQTKEQSEKKDDENVREMSYAEYLESIVDECEDEADDKADHDPKAFTQIIDSAGLKHEILDCYEDMKVKKTTLTSGKSKISASAVGIAKFFNVTTSTPNKPKESPINLGSQDENEVCEEKPNVSPLLKGNKKGKRKITKLKSIKIDVEKKAESDLEISIIEETIVKQKSTFLKSTDKIVNPEKAKQSVLSFGSTGLTMSKQPVKQPATGTDNDVKIPDKPKPGKRGRKKKVVTEVRTVSVVDTTNESVFDSPRRGRKRKPVVVEESTDLEESVFSPGEGERRQSARKKYRVTAFQMDFYQKTPIKLKLKRCGKSSSSCDEELAQLKTLQQQVRMKLNKAQLLLEKARKNKQKRKEKNKEKKATSKADTEEKVIKKNKKITIESIINDPSRRSSRLVGRPIASMEEVSLDNIVISSDEETHLEEPIKKKRGRPKGSLNIVGTPKKDKLQKEGPKNATPIKKTLKIATPKKSVSTPKKSKSPKKGGKLAPLFFMGKSKGLLQSSPAKPPLDPEQARQRQQFLMSGVPEELRKQTAIRLAATVEADYPPLPKINHVQQIPSCISSAVSWNLNKVDLKLRSFLVSDPPAPVSTFNGCLARISLAAVDLSCIKKFECHAKLEDSQVEEFLGEVASFNPTYPVQRVFQALKQSLPAITAGPKTDESKSSKSTEVVITLDDEELPPKKRKARRSLKLKKKVEEEEEEGPDVQKLPVVEPVKVAMPGKGPCLLWTDKYYPSNTSEVLGNGSILKKMKNWLIEWKHVLDREARKARKLLMKKNKGKVVAKTDAEDQWDDDSDFDMDSEDSEDDTSLCNTLLLAGPNGCGKTCSVYALAQELGFKVHEVNASVSRSGRHILSQLQEATQSHQVSSHGCSTPSKKPLPAAVEKPVNTKMSASFSNFFKKSADEKADNSKKEKKRKRNLSDKDTSPNKKRRKKEQDVIKPTVIDERSRGWTKAINLTSTALILFDEVDVFFEEDKGFLSAIQTFMSTTKIPIILTTSDPGFTAVFEGRYEQLTLRAPPVRSIVSRLQTISLLESVRTDIESLSELVQCYHGDVRKCIVALQFVLGSGGSHIQKYRVPQKPVPGGKTLPTIAEDSQDYSQEGFSQGPQTMKTDTSDKQFDEDDDDFVVVKSLQARKKRFLDDDSSVSGEVFAEVFLQKQALVGAASSENEAEAKKFPPVHVIGVETCYGICREDNLELLESMLKYLKGQSSSPSHILDVCNTLRKTINCNILYNNLPVILPLPVKVVDSVATATDSKIAMPKPRKRIQNDLYDSEASNDASDHDIPVEANDEIKNTESKEENQCLFRGLSSFAKYYDTMSAIDVMENVERSQLIDNLQSVGGHEVRGRLVGGMGSRLPDHCVGTSVDLDQVLDYSVEIEAGATRRMYREVETVQGQVETLCNNNPAFSQEFVMPVMKGRETFRLLDSDKTSGRSEAKRACENVQDNLPLVTHKQRRNLHTDYLPTLREMCRFEQCRQLTNTKRRFQHYFDCVNLSLRDRTIGVLSTTFL